MTAKNRYSEENATSFKELTEFTHSLTESQLLTPMPAAWTVSAVLAHLAFWDFRGITLIKKWQSEGIHPSPNDVDVVNESTRPLLIAIEPQKAIEVCLKYATELDQLIDSLSPEFIQDIEENGKTVRLDRSTHRHTHMREIKAALGIG